jgi:hypothetical protein
MNKQPTTIRTYLLRGAFLLALLFLVTYVIPLALGQPPPCDYTTTTSTGNAIVPGLTDTGNHCDDCTTPIAFPFPVTLYGTTFTTANVSSNGNLQFTTSSPYLGVSCPLPEPNLGESILLYQDDLRTDGAGDGIFTSVEGVVGSRIFNIEWRTTYFGRTGTANFEVRLFEATSCFEVIYGATADNGSSEESGVQQSGTGPATTFSCLQATLTNGLKVTYCCTGGPTPTPTPTPPVNQGCSPGYWKQPPHFQSWCGGYTPNTPVASTGLLTNTCGCNYNTLTMLQALRLSSFGRSVCGAQGKLYQAAVAALLNACSVNYPLTTAQIIAEVNAALASCDRTTILNEASRLNTFNNLGCPLP